MLYYLFEYLDKTYDVPGAGLFNFITFRAILAVILSLFIATVYGKKIIKYLQKKQVGIHPRSWFGRSKRKSWNTNNGWNHHYSRYTDSCIALREAGKYLRDSSDSYHTMDGSHRFY